jgi:hypothetical protein
MRLSLLALIVLVVVGRLFPSVKGEEPPAPLDEDDDSPNGCSGWGG